MFSRVVYLLMVALCMSLISSGKCSNETSEVSLDKLTEVPKWSFKDDSKNITCIIVQMKIDLNITYTKNDNTTGRLLYTVPSSAVVNRTQSSCNKEEDKIQIDWGMSNSFMVNFEANETLKNYGVYYIEFHLNTSDLVANASSDEMLKLVFKNEKGFMVHMNHSYHCNRVQKVNLTTVVEENDEAEPLSQLIVSGVQFEAFRTKVDDKFSSAMDCDSSNTTDVVPIAVGAALIALICFVLIAYLVGRKRQQARGYLSM